MHRALGRDLDTLVVAVIDNKRAMLAVMLAMLAAIGIGRVVSFESPTEALDAMRNDVPDLVVAASAMQPLTGCALVKAMRHADGEPLCFVPAVIMSAHARPSHWRMRSAPAPIRCWSCRSRRALSIDASTGCSTTIVPTSCPASTM
jgi:CheY-like chemotaxis protein